PELYTLSLHDALPICGYGVLGVVNDLDVNGQVLLQRVDKGGDGSIARARHRHGLAIDREPGPHRRPGVGGSHLVADEGERGRLGDRKSTRLNSSHRTI